ncbi:MAG: hypothetical protein OXC15_19800 [Rhodospirillaceae bacterium]|nr:hypothetical protein [Rhodospirillaceae bacterium]
MKTGHSLLPIAVLATCLWVADAMAQAVSTPPGASREGGPAVHADIGTHGTGERPGTGDHPATAQRAAVTVSSSAGELKQRALTAMETLREEIATLAALKRAQEALLAWNRLAWDRLAWDRGRTEGGEAPVFLASALCAEPALGAWCPLLPATFGTPSPTAEESHDRD